MTKDEFGLEITKLRKSLLNYAYYLTRNRDDAEDLLQTASLRALRKLDQYRYGSFTTWMKILIYCDFINGKRTYCKQSENRKITCSMESLFEDPESEDVTIGGVIYLDETVPQRVRQALLKLPEEVRATFLLAYLDEYDYVSIADFTDVPIGTVRSRLFRAKDFLRNNLKDYVKQYGFRYQ